MPRAPGGHIYVYKLGANFSPHQVAWEAGQVAAHRHLLSRSSPVERFLDACWRADSDKALQELGEHPELIAEMRPAELRLMADAAWGNRLDAVRLMLEAGFDPDEAGSGEGTALDRAAIHGFAPIVELLLKKGASTSLENDHGGDPLDAALWGVTNSWRDDGDHAATLEFLIAATTIDGRRWRSTGRPEIDALLDRHEVLA